MDRGQKDLLNGKLVNSEQTVLVRHRRTTNKFPRPLRERAGERGQYNCAKHLDIDSIRVPQEHRKGLFHCFTVHCSQKQVAFTLAEVLITLAIIGVVAAVTMPVLITNINDRVNFERHANIAYKVTQAMEQMRAHGKLVQYANTSAFVDELQKYLKISKRCDADNIAKCWPTDTIIDASGEEYPVRKAKKRKNILKGSISGNPDDNNVGLILADGASIILTYDNTKEPVDAYGPVTAVTIKNTKEQDIAYSITPTTASIDFLTDVNGKKGPNKEGKDIRSFSAAHFAWTGHACDDGPEGCLYKLPTYSPVNCSTTAANYAGNEYCGPNPSGYENDYWAGAKLACAEAGMTLPDAIKLKAIGTVKSQYNHSNANISANYGWFWSSNEHSQIYAERVTFSEGWPYSYKSDQNHVLCIE